MRSKIIVLILGFVLGLVAAQLAPRFWQRLAPPALQGGAITGWVESKLREDDRLLLTLVTESGSLLATFSVPAPEVDLLIDEGDTVALSMRRYRPFVEDPVIVRVVKPAPEEPAPGAEEADRKPADTGAAEPGLVPAPPAEAGAQDEPPAGEDEASDAPPDEPPADRL